MLVFHRITQEYPDFFPADPRSESNFLSSHLDAKRNGKVIDKFNQQGENYQFGLEIDSDIRNNGITLSGNLCYVLFEDTDNINLTGDDIDFEILYATGAIMFNNYGRVTPVLEALLVHDFQDFTSFSVSPEIIYTMSDGLDIKFGAPFNLTSDGQDYAAELELTYRFWPALLRDYAVADEADRGEHS